jgi:hypothetical protein
MKATQSRAVAMSDLFRAIAGEPEAQFDLIACTVYSAARTLMQAGNKTQFNKLQADANMYGADTSEANKAAKEALGAKTLTAQVKRFKQVYFALQIALAQCGVPADMQKELPQDKVARDAALDAAADAYSAEFTSIFIATVSMPEKTDEERAAASAAAKAKREEKAKAAEKTAKQERAELEQTIRASIGETRAPSIDDVLDMAINALKAGLMTDTQEQALRVALSIRETDKAIAAAAAAEPVAA